MEPELLSEVTRHENETKKGEPEGDIRKVKISTPCSTNLEPEPISIPLGFLPSERHYLNPSPAIRGGYDFSTLGHVTAEKCLVYG